MKHDQPAPATGVYERLDVATCGDPFQVHLHEQRYAKALEEVAPSDHLLEVGTGLGVFSSRVAPVVARYRGIEYDHVACAAAKTRVPDPDSIQQGDAQSLDFPDAHFDVIVCLEVLEHLPDYRKALNEFKRVLRPNGKLIASIPYAKVGAPSKTNPHHLYEPGDEEFQTELNSRFKRIEIYYQRYEENAIQTVARKLRLRRLLGLHTRYRNLVQGSPEELSNIMLDRRRTGLLLDVFIIARNPRR